MGNVLASMLDHDEARLVGELYRSLGFVRFGALIRAIAEYLARIARGSYAFLSSALLDNTTAVAVPTDGNRASNGDLRRTRSHSLAFPEDTKEEITANKRICAGSSIAEIETYLLQLEDISEPSSSNICHHVNAGSAKVEADCRFFDLPYDVAYLISKRFQLVPKVKWAGLMYSCKFWNSMLSGPFLLSAGLLYAPAPSVTAVYAVLELSGIEAYLGLSHWRRSEHFAHVDTVKFKLSKDDATRNIQLSCMSNFFASLTLNVRHIRAVRIFLSDYDCGVDLSALSNVVKQLHRTGCVDFWIYSSYLPEQGRNDLPSTDETEFNFTHAIEHLVIQSSSVFSASMAPWLIRTLEAGTALATIDVSSAGWGPFEWAYILPRINSHRLKTLRLVGADVSNVAPFLGRHPSVSSILLDGLELNEDLSSIGTVRLPNLTTIEGDEMRIAYFLELLEPTTSLRFATIVFREDCSTDMPSDVFDTEAYLKAFRLLASLGDTSLTLSFNFSSLRQFSTSTFLRPTHDDQSRPERQLSVDRLEVNIFGDTTADCIDLLDACLVWTPLFAKVRFLRVWVAGLMLTYERRKAYTLLFSNALPGAAIYIS
ncbi:hypothetical protein SCHPADRAFT_892219 [Schizopora paradoxa]|uniref:F-box domain-containing protein n=1 Tax=Schizopora paradoxa TaxID=27342 RepID=A0A0H2RG89_9AGAM|nr:hypothetical protein SCHPADRAFT_892219 [Schizopora paradoxa]